MERKIDLDRLWLQPSPAELDRKVNVITFQQPTDIIIRRNGKQARHGPFRSVIFDQQNSRFILVLELGPTTDYQAVPSKDNDQLLFWPTGKPLGPQP